MLVFSFILNDGKWAQSGPYFPQKGDPLSSYLFILCAKGLCSLIRKAKSDCKLHGMNVCRRAPSISHLLFVDDNFFFGARPDECTTMKEIFNTYTAASGQMINLINLVYCFVIMWHMIFNLAYPICWGFMNHFIPTDISLQEIHSLPTKITDGLNSVGNYRRNIDGTKHIIFPHFCYHLPTEYLRKITDGSVP